jgi:hypothetical protein
MRASSQEWRNISVFGTRRGSPRLIHHATSNAQFHLPRSASWIEEMEKRSRRRIRDLVALAAFQGLSQNEIGCARISMMARSTNPPFKGRIQKRKTNRLQIIKSNLQRTAGPYKSARSSRSGMPIAHDSLRWIGPLRCDRLGRTR